MVEYFERKANPEFVFLKVMKNYQQMSLNVFQSSANLLWNSEFQRNSMLHRSFLNLSVFALRQSLELKFKRIVGVADIYNSKIQNPKIRHDFFVEFLIRNRDLIAVDNVSFQSIGIIYKWTNDFVHFGALPRVWEMQYAIEYCSRVFDPDLPKAGEGWDIHNAVQILDYDELLKRFFEETHFFLKEDFWCFVISKPEAEINKR